MYRLRVFPSQGEDFEYPLEDESIRPLRVSIDRVLNDEIAASTPPSCFCRYPESAAGRSRR